MERKNIIVLIIIFLILTIVGFYSYWLLTSFPFVGKIELSKTGVFGDSFGILTSAFSGLAFAGLIWTILLQREDLSRQRNEFFKLNFENSLFFLLKSHKEITLQVNCNNISGVNAFEMLYEQFSMDYRSALKKTWANEENIPKKDKDRLKIAGAYLECFGFEENQPRQYMKSVFYIISYIHNAKHETRQYIDLLQSQLSDFELLLIFYYCLSDKGLKYKPLIEATGFLQDILLYRLINYHDDASLYDKSAFGSTNV
ncbi:MAG: putative phage abortive infection protein [Methylococcaceae bacterium]